MKVIVAGSRNFTNYDFLCAAISRSGFDITTVICGGAKGVDSLGEKWAENHKADIEYYRPDWDRYGKRAGMVRNEAMLKAALPDGALIVIIVNNSPGSTGMLNLAKAAGLKYYAVHITEERG